MATTRDWKSGYNRRRATNLMQARRERALNQERERRFGTDDLEHDRRREEILIDGPKWEQEGVYDDAYHY